MRDTARGYGGVKVGPPCLRTGRDAARLIGTLEVVGRLFDGERYSSGRPELDAVLKARNTRSMADAFAIYCVPSDMGYGVIAKTVAALGYWRAGDEWESARYDACA